MIKLLAAFLIGWLACIVVASHRNRVNGEPTRVYTQSGRRVR